MALRWYAPASALDQRELADEPDEPVRAVAPGKRPRTLRIQRKQRRSDAPAPDATELVARGLGGSGAPLPAALRRRLEQASGKSLAGVRVHTGPDAARAADAIGAAAFTVGNHIAFALGTYAPGTADGDRLIAHEVAHAAQHGDRAIAEGEVEISESHDAGEREADAFADAFVTGAAAPALSAAPRDNVVSRLGLTTALTTPVLTQAALEQDLPPITKSLEQSIRSQLSRDIEITDSTALRARLIELATLVSGAGSEDKAALRERIGEPSPHDSLARQFHQRLDTQSRRALIDRLHGKVTPLPEPDDAITREGFAYQLDDSSLDLPRAGPVLHPELAPDTVVQLTASAKKGPAAAEPFVIVHWRVHSDRGDNVFSETASWPDADKHADPVFVPIDAAGRYDVYVIVEQAGETVASLAGSFEVRMAVDTTDAALNMSAEDRRAAFAANEAQLADAGLSSDERMRLADENALLELGAAASGEEIHQPLDPGPDAVIIDGVAMSTDPVFCRGWIDRMYAAHGPVAAMHILASGMRDRERKASEADYNRVSKENDAIQHAVTAQLRLLETELTAFESTYQAAAEAVTREMLDASEAKVDDELERYGVHDVEEWRARGPIVNQVADDNLATRDMVHAAGELVYSQQKIDELRTRYARVRAEVERRQRQDALEDGDITLPDVVEGLDVLIDPPDRSDDDELYRLASSLVSALGRAETEHARFVRERETDFPVLSSYKSVNGELVTMDIEGLSSLDASTGASDAAERLTDTKRNIIRTRDAIGGALKIWEEPRIMALANKRTMVVRGTARARAIADRAEDESGADWEDWALGALAFAFAAVTFIPTGGASAAVVGAVVVAEIGGLALDAYLLMDSIEEYTVDEAKLGTDLDRAKAVAGGDPPSTLWLAVDILSFGVSLGAATKTFREMRTAWHAAIHAEQMAQFDEAVAAIHEAARGGRISADAVATLEKRIASERAGADLIEDAASETERVVTADDFEMLEKRLGTRVVRDSSRETGVGVHTVPAGDAGVSVTHVAVGKTARIGDVLEHGRTIKRITRYNGLVGDARRMWDDLVVALGGKVDRNPFPPGTEIARSFEEVKKLGSIIETRRAKWAANGVDKDLIDEEIEFLEGEVEHHADIVRAADEGSFDPSGGWIELPDIGRSEAAALKEGYQKAPKNAECYYFYRRPRPGPNEPRYELRIKPSADPKLDLPKYEFHERGGKWVPEEVISPTRKAANVFDAAMSDADVYEALTGPGSTSSFVGFSQSLFDHKLGTKSEIVAHIKSYRATRAGQAIHEDDLRHVLKEKYRTKIRDYITDPALTDEASYTRMRDVTDGMAVKDRATFVEDWTQGRHRPTGEREAFVSMDDLDAQDIALDGDRRIDIRDGNVACEVKSHANKLSREDMLQIEDTVRMARREAVVGSKKIDRADLVFTNPDGVAANATFLEKILTGDADGKVTITVYTAKGTKKSITSVSALRAFIAAN